jgi:Galactose-3-O-sulfotransferase
MIGDVNANEKNNRRDPLDLSTWKRLCNLLLCLFLTIVIAFLLKVQTSDSKPSHFLNAITDDDIGSLSSMKNTKHDIGFPHIYYPVDSGAENMYWPLISDEHLKFMPRVYTQWNSSTSWCQVESAFDTRTPAGLIYVKNHKAASSTLAGVNIRIAVNYGRRHLQSNRGLLYPQRRIKPNLEGACSSRENHDDSRKYHERDPSRSFMYTSIRHPVHRALSWIFYLASNQGRNISDNSIIQRLKRQTHFVKGTSSKTSKFHYEAGAQVGYLYTGKHAKKYLWQEDKLVNLPTSLNRVSTVMREYDLFLIVERLDESLVALKFLLKLETSDILYLSAKQSGGYSYSAAPFEGCHKIIPSYISSAVSDFLSSPLWYAQNYEDYVLYKAANKSLDMTIEKIGRSQFESALAEYRNMMNDVKVCANETVEPCSSDGTYHEKTDCFYRDWGCGYPCLDRWN